MLESFQEQIKDKKHRQNLNIFMQHPNINAIYLVNG